MNSGLAIRIIKLSTGEHHPVLVDSGVPLVLPSLWAYDLSLSTSFNTVKAYVGDVLQLYRWAQLVGMNLHRQFEILKKPSPSQLRALAKFVTTLADGRPAARSSCDRKLVAISSFLVFAYDHFIAKKALSLVEQRQAEKNRDSTIARLSKLFLMHSRQSELGVHASAISAQKVDALDAVARPDSPSNPFCEAETRVRNYCIWRVMLETGARRAEIVLLEIDDVRLGPQPAIAFKRPSLATRSRRKDGASMKTNPRLLPISNDLAALIEAYLEDWRDSLLKPRRPCTALFPSARDGRRLSVGAINKILSQVLVADSSGPVERVHPHGIRKTALDELSRKDRDEKGRSSSSFRDSLTYFAGWSPGSEMPLLYLNESIRDSLNRLMREPRRSGS